MSRSGPPTLAAVAARAWGAGEAAYIGAHQLEVADVAIDPRQARPQASSIGSAQPTPPLGGIVAGHSSGEALGNGGAAPTQLRCGCGMVGAGGVLDPVDPSPLRRNAEPAQNHGSVLEDREVDQTLSADGCAVGFRFDVHEGSILGTR
jgi:hypothetical protein